MLTILYSAFLKDKFTAEMQRTVLYMLYDKFRLEKF